MTMKLLTLVLACAAVGAFALASPASAVRIPPPGAPAGCAGLEACGTATAVNSCFSYGAGEAQGVSSNPATVWTFRLHTSSYAKPSAHVVKTQTGPAAAFFADDPDKSLWLGDVYTVSVALYADEKLVATDAIGCA